MDALIHFALDEGQLLSNHVLIALEERFVGLNAKEAYAKRRISSQCNREAGCRKECHKKHKPQTLNSIPAPISLLMLPTINEIEDKVSHEP